jgi:hypothetical protein
MATTPTAAASGRHSRLNQADSRQCEQGYKRFTHHASSIGTISFPRMRHFLQQDYSAIEGSSRSTDREPGSIDHRSYKYPIASQDRKRSVRSSQKRAWSTAHIGIEELPDLSKKFAVTARRFPDSSKKFPVHERREFAAKSLIVRTEVTARSAEQAIFGENSL